MEYITSRTNALMTHVRKLISDRKYRRKMGEMVCEGPKMLQEAMASGSDISVIIQTEKEAHWKGLDEKVRVVCVSEDLLRSLSDTKTPQDILFLCRIPKQEMPDLLHKGNYLVLDGLQDPGNVGTIWRTADAFGAKAIICLAQCADPWSPKTLRASMGACFRLPVMESTADALHALLKDSDIPLYATALRSDTYDVGDVALQHVAVVIGSEGSGVSEEVLSRCEKTVKIPMRERCESLNASVAASVILWEMAKQEIL